MRSIKEMAYAKINLYLNVLERREDGFHGIETVMHTLSLADEVTLTVIGMGKRAVRLTVDGSKWLPTDKKNIAYSAAMLFMERAGIDATVQIRLVKRIPVAAGLAGGSADGAAVLRGMNRLFGRPLTDKMLLSLASELGSDLPYCLLGGTALCTGRGESITRLKDSLDLHCVVAVSSGEHVSTPSAYSMLDEMYSNFDGSVPDISGDALMELLSSIENGSLECSGLFNIFEGAVLSDCQGAREIKSRLLSLGARHALMSGSGPSVFGIFDTEVEARAAATSLTESGFVANYARSVRR